MKRVTLQLNHPPVRLIESAISSLCALRTEQRVGLKPSESELKLLRRQNESLVRGGMVRDWEAQREW